MLRVCDSLHIKPARAVGKPPIFQQYLLPIHTAWFILRILCIILIIYHRTNNNKTLFLFHKSGKHASVHPAIFENRQAVQRESVLITCTITQAL